MTIGTADTQSVTISKPAGSDSKDTKQAIYNNGSDTTIRGKSILIDYGVKGAEAVRSTGFGSLTIGGAETESVIIKSAGDGLVLLPYSNNGSSVAKSNGKLTVNAKNIVIDAAAYGIWAQNNSTGFEGEFAKLTLKGENVSINAGTAAIVAMSQADVEVIGNTYIKAKDAILARGLSKVTINKSGTDIVQIEGDLNFNYDKKTSGTTVDATVDVTLSGKDSFWKGNVATTWGDDKPEDLGKLEVNESKLTLKDGAQWTVTEVADSEAEHSRYTALNNLVLDGGVINVTEGKQTLKVEKVSGSGGTINVATTEGADGALTVDRKIEIGEAAKSTNLTVTDPTLNADTVKDSDKVLAALNGAVSTTTGEITQTNRIEEGAVNGAITETVVGGQSQGVVQAENTKLSAFGSVAALSAFQWRHDMNDLTKRMGELRTSPEGIGTWARLYGSEQEYGSLQAKNTSIQVGSDVDVGMGWKVGAAFSYTDGNATYADGDADNKAYGLGIYGTWMAENGQFVDLIAKYSRLDTDFALNGMNGGFENNAYSVSAEYGWHLKLGQYAFVEPQAELTYGQVLGDTFTTANGVKVEQDDFDAFIGRIGVRGGFHFPDNKGVVYVRASVLHDFEGESTAVASLINDSSVRKGINEDLGGTWYEVGVGANFNVTDNTYTYVDLEKTSGGEVKENWRWNVGMRYVW